MTSISGKAYAFDPKTRAYLGITHADPSPRERGEFIAPAFATLVAPPELKAGQLAILDADDKTWRVVDLPPEAIAAAEEAAAEMTIQAKIEQWRKWTRERLDAIARAAAFDSMDEAVSYAEEPSVPRYQILGRALRNFRSLTWAAFDSLESTVRASGPAPADRQALDATLPAFQIPDTSPAAVERWIAEQSGVAVTAY